MMSIVLLRHVVIATERSTDRPCALDMYDTSHRRILVYHETQNLEIALREVRDFQVVVLPFGDWVIGPVGLLQEEYEIN